MRVTKSSKGAGLKGIRAALDFFLLVTVEEFGQSLATFGFLVSGKLTSECAGC